MLEEFIVRDQEVQRERSIQVNLHIIKLLQQKTIPLNKQRYEHLQKISKALCKQPKKNYIYSNQQTAHHQPLSPLKQKLPSFQKIKSTRVSPIFTADLLINRLKNLKDLKNRNQMDDETGKYWEILRNNILKSETASPSKKSTQTTIQISHSVRGKKENMLNLAQKAEHYLRIKKRDLKSKHSQNQEYKLNGRNREVRPTQIEQLLINFKSIKRQRRMTNQQLQRELLEDIREGLFEQKINRMKKDINHRKIVQMR